MIRSELRDAVISRVGREDKNTEINEFLDLGIVELTKLHKFRELIGTSDLSVDEDETYVDLPSDNHQLVEARLIDGTSSYVLSIKSKKYITERWPNISAVSTTKPLLGYVENNDLFLYPIPDATYTIRITYDKQVGAFSAPATEELRDAVECPISGLDYSLICWTSAELFDSLEQFEKGDVWRKKSLGALAQAILADKRDVKILQHQEFRGKEEDSEFPLNPWEYPFAKRST